MVEFLIWLYGPEKFLELSRNGSTPRVLGVTLAMFAGYMYALSESAANSSLQK